MTEKVKPAGEIPPAAAPARRMFPIQGGESIPWDIIAPFDYWCQKNHGGQTLEGLARRGGLGVSEAIAVLLASNYDDYWTKGNRYEQTTPASRILQLQQLVREREIARSDSALRLALHALEQVNIVGFGTMVYAREITALLATAAEDKP